MNDECLSPCSSFILHRSSLERSDGWYVLISTTGEIHDHDALDRLAVAQEPAEGVRRLERRDDSFRLTQFVKRLEREIVAAIVVLHAADAVQMRMLRPD